MRKAMSVGWLMALTAVAVQADAPVNNPVADRYRGDAPAWVGELKWSQVVNIADFDNKGLALWDAVARAAEASDNQGYQ